jgi:hypothetical protein
MSRASVYTVLNSEVVVDIYQLMELLIGQAVADFSIDESKCALVPLASSSCFALRDKSYCKLLKCMCGVTEHFSPCTYK